jgi:hypothetical protein
MVFALKINSGIKNHILSYRAEPECPTRSSPTAKPPRPNRAQQQEPRSLVPKPDTAAPPPIFGVCAKLQGAVRLYKAAATASRALAAALAFPRASLAGADRSRRARAPPAARLNLPTRSAARARRRHHQLHQVKPHTRRRFPSPLRHQSVAVAVDASCRVVIAAGEM